MAAAARFFSRLGKRNKQQAANSRFSHCIVIRAPRAGMRCKIATSPWSPPNTPDASMDHSKRTKQPKNAIEPGHFGHSLQLLRPPIGRTAKSDQVL